MCSAHALDFPVVSRDLSRVGKNWKDLGRAVAYARKAAGLTQSDLSTLIEQRGEPVSSRTLGSLERGEPVSDTTLQRVAAALAWPPSTPQAILDGLVHVGLAGEMLPSAGAQFSGSGRLTTASASPGPIPTTRRMEETTLQDARQAIADHERDFHLAAADAGDLLTLLNWTLTGRVEGEDPLQLVEDVRSEIDKMVTFDQGRRYWQRQAESLLRQEPKGSIAARRGRRQRDAETTDETA